MAGEFSSELPQSGWCLLGWHMGGCQNYGPLWDPHYNTAPNI